MKFAKMQGSGKIAKVDIKLNASVSKTGLSTEELPQPAPGTFFQTSRIVPSDIPSLQVSRHVLATFLLTSEILSFGA